MAWCGANGNWRANRNWRLIVEHYPPASIGCQRAHGLALLLAKGAQQVGETGQPVIMCAPARTTATFARAPLCWQLRFQPVRPGGQVRAVICRLQLLVGWLGVPGKATVMPWFLPAGVAPVLVGSRPRGAAGPAASSGGDYACIRHLVGPAQHSVHPADRKLFFDALSEAHRTRSHFSIDCRLRLPHGEYHHHRLIGAPQHGPAGELLGWVGGSQNREVQAQTSRIRRSFLRLASHELNTPLTSLTLNLQTALLRAENLAQAGGSAPSLPLANASTPLAVPSASTHPPAPRPNMVSPLRRAVEQARRLGDTVDLLLDVQCLLSGRLPLKRTCVDLSQLLHNTLSLLEPTLLTAGCRISCETAARLIGLFDAARMQQVFFHLLSNVAKFAPGSHVRLVGREEPAGIRIFVHDDGPGIPKEAAKEVFSLFGRASPDRSTSGLGLGLFLCRRIVRAHGGQLQLDEEAKKGAHFCVTLPVHRATERPPNSSASSPLASASAPTRPRSEDHGRHNLAASRPRMPAHVRWQPASGGPC